MLHHQIIRCDQATEWIVFIHGAGGSSNVWYRQVRSFSRHYNLLLVDLRGHGLSAMQHSNSRKVEAANCYTFRSLAKDVTGILDLYHLSHCHFIGLSLGTIIIREIAEMDRSYIRSMILAGAILKLDFRTRLLSKAANALKHCIPYMALYKFYAYLIMPRPAHRKSRMLFISNAIKITHDEFMNWMTLNRNLKQLMDIYDESEPPIPALYLMGANDYVFLSQVRLRLRKFHDYSYLYIIPQAGHICNIDQSEVFNAVCTTFLHDSTAIGAVA